MSRGARLDGRAFCETGVLVRPRLVFVVSGAAIQDGVSNYEGTYGGPKERYLWAKWAIC